MGFFDKKAEVTKEQSSFDWFSTGFSQGNKTLTQIVFETLKKTPLKMQFIVDIIDADSVEDLRDSLEDLDCDIENGSINQDTSNYAEIVALLYVLGVEIKLNGRKIATREPSKKERIDFLIDCEDLCCDIIWTIKLAAYIEENNEVLSKISDSAADEDYTIGEICELASKLSMIKYEDFMIISR